MEEFPLDCTSPDGRHSNCRECRRSADRNRKRGKVRTDRDKAKDAAMQRLIRNHMGEFAKLYYSELILAGVIEPTMRPNQNELWLAEMALNQAKAS